MGVPAMGAVRYLFGISSPSQTALSVRVMLGVELAPAYGLVGGLGIRLAILVALDERMASERDYRPYAPTREVRA